MREEVGHRYAPATRIFYSIDLWPQHCAGLLIMFSLLQSKLITLNEIYPEDEVIEYIFIILGRRVRYTYMYLYMIPCQQQVVKAAKNDIKMQYCQKIFAQTANVIY